DKEKEYTQELVKRINGYRTSKRLAMELYNNLRTTMGLLHVEHIKLKKDIRRKEDAYDTLQATYQSTNDKLKLWEDNHIQMIANFQQNQQTTKTLQSKIKEYKQQLEEQQDKEHALQAKNQDLQEDLHLKDAQYQALRDAKNTTISSLRETVTIQQADILSHLNEIKDLRHTLNDEQAKNTTLQIKLTELNATVQQKQDRIQELESEVKSLRSEKAELVKKTRQLNELLGATQKTTTKATKFIKKPELKQTSINTVLNEQWIKKRASDTVDTHPRPHKQIKIKLEPIEQSIRATVPISASSTDHNSLTSSTRSKHTENISSVNSASSNTTSFPKVKPTHESNASRPLASVTNTRHRHDRAHLQGETCKGCADFYAGDPLTTHVDGQPVQITCQDRIQLHSRHRFKQRATTPPGFWQLDFASPPDHHRVQH
ncbi:hypothetical protein CU098_001151, partial [Rhizopus stolonifer]